MRGRRKKPPQKTKNFLTYQRPFFPFYRRDLISQQKQKLTARRHASPPLAPLCLLHTCMCMLQCSLFSFEMHAMLPSPPLTLSLWSADFWEDIEKQKQNKGEGGGSFQHSRRASSLVILAVFTWSNRLLQCPFFLKPLDHLQRWFKCEEPDRSRPHTGW